MKRWTRRDLADGAALCMELGAGLLENGAETSRVEESIRLAGEALGLMVETVVYPTSIAITFGGEEPVTRIFRIREREINLDKVSKINDLARSLQEDRPNLSEFRDRVREVREAPDLYSFSQQFFAIGLACASFAVFLGGGWQEALFAAVAGMLSGLVLDYAGNCFPSFLSLFLVGFVCTAFGLAGQYYGFVMEVIVVGALLPRMPGLAIVSAMRDLMAGDLVAGVARAAEALLITLGMASGVLACVSFALRLGISDRI